MAHRERVLIAAILYSYFILIRQLLKMTFISVPHESYYFQTTQHLNKSELNYTVSIGSVNGVLPFGVLPFGSIGSV